MALRSVLVTLGLALVAGPGDSAAQTASDSQTSRGRASVPFGAGERLDYEAKLSGIRVGNGWMEVSKIDSVRGREDSKAG